MHTMASSDVQIVQVRKRDLSKAPRSRCEGTQFKYSWAEFVRAVGSAYQGSIVDELSGHSVGGRGRDSGVAGQFGEGEASASCVEGS